MKDLRDEIKRPKMSVKNPVKQIMDENNTENIILYDDQNNPIEFEQIAYIVNPKNDKSYAILIPITTMEGVEEGEGVLFEIDEEKGDLKIINDVDVIDEVLKIYQKLLDEGDKSNK